MKQIVVTHEQADSLFGHFKKKRKELLKKAKSAPKMFVDMIECMADSKDFESFSEPRKEFIRDFLNARK